MVCAGIEQDWADRFARPELKLRYNVFRRSAMKIGTPRQRRDTSIAWFQPCSFRRQCRIRRAGANHDPVRVIASLLRKVKRAREYFTSLQLNRIAALGLVDGLLKIISGAHRYGVARRGSVRHRAAHVNPRQLCRAVELRLLSV